MDTYENHEAFNRHLSLEGYRVNGSGTSPSVYITEVKLKRAIKELSDKEIEDVFDNEMTPHQIRIHREKLIRKMESLQKWQLLKALEILLTEGRIESVSFISKCKRTDKEIN